MKTTFIGQGIKAKGSQSTGKTLFELLEDGSLTKFTCLTAFASRGAVSGLINKTRSRKSKFEEISIIVGIDQFGTSKEALEELLEFNEAQVKVFYQRERIIFHPKIYILKGDKKIKIIIGSSNLTIPGIFQNIEGGILFEFKTTDADGVRLLDQIENYFKEIIEGTDSNSQMLTSELISIFEQQKLILSDKRRREIHEKKHPKKSKSKEKFNNLFPKKNILFPIKGFSSKSSKKKAASITKTKKIVIKSKPSKLLWESGPLTQRDLNIPKGKGTNATGSMLFKKGKTKDIDQRHYFRDVVFSSLKWKGDKKPRTSHLERAKGLFKLIILGKDCGGFDLKLTHNTNTSSKSYEQKNSMTHISWGKAKELIAKDDLIGKTAYLYKNKGKKKEFTIEIK